MICKIYILWNNYQNKTTPSGDKIRFQKEENNTKIDYQLMALTLRLFPNARPQLNLNYFDLVCVMVSICHCWLMGWMSGLWYKSSGFKSLCGTIIPHHKPYSQTEHSFNSRLPLFSFLNCPLPTTHNDQLPLANSLQQVTCWSLTDNRCQQNLMLLNMHTQKF